MGESTSTDLAREQSRLPIAPGETSSSAIAAREKAAVEARFLMALHRPRDFETARRRLLDACKRIGFAAEARYAKPVGRDKVYGLSIRFAEEARVLWGNMDVNALLVFDDDERRIYRVQATDLETNATDGTDVMVEKFIERRSTKEGQEIIGKRLNSGGQTVYKVRATEDDLVVKVNAQLSKARRNSILALLPADVKEECEGQCVATLQSEDVQDPTAARKRLLDSFWKYGVTPAQIGELLGHPADSMNPAEMTLLRSYGTALKEGEATWAEIVDAHTGGKKTPADAPSVQAKGTDGIKEALGKKTSSTPAVDPPTTGVTAKCEACGRADGKHEPACPYAD